MNTEPTLVVLAAGMGSRYGGLKQIDPVGPSGEVILDYSVYDAIRAGFGKVVFVIRSEIEQAFREALGDKFADRIPVEYAFQRMDDLPGGFAVPPGRAKPWGTTHATLACRDLIQEPFAVINADDFYGRGSFVTVADALRKRIGSSGDHVLVGFPLANTVSEHGTVSRGICAVQDGRLCGIEECHEIHPIDGGISVKRAMGIETMDGTQTVSMNLWGFTPDVFSEGLRGFQRFLKNMADPLKSEYYIPSLVQDLIDAGRGTVEVLQSDSEWLGVTYPEDKPSVVQGLRRLVDVGEYPESLWGGKDGSR